MDGRPFLGNGPSTTPKILNNEHTATRTTTTTTTMDTDGGRRNWFGIRTRPVGIRGPGNQLGQIRGREKCPVYKDGTRTKSGRY